MDSDFESKLYSLISQLLPFNHRVDSDWESMTISLIIQIISLIRSVDFDSQLIPESKLMSLVTQTISLFNSMDLYSLPEPLSKLISLISQNISTDSDREPESDMSFTSLLAQTLELRPDPQLVSLIRQIVSVVISTNPELKKLISLCPQLQVDFSEGKFHVTGEVRWERDDEKIYNRLREPRVNCFLGKWEKCKSFWMTAHYTTHFFCTSCNGEYHEECENAPLEIKHHLHQRHSLQLVLYIGNRFRTRECYCCDKDLYEIFYYCSACDYAMNIACVDKPPVSHIDRPKWHEHTLALFPRRKAFLNCNLCALVDSTSPIYMCPPCDFVVHLVCLNLPRVIRISRHPHRITYTASFEEGNWSSCGVCRRKVENDYGGYSCTKDGCSYAVHSRCATQSNVWDGIDLEGVPKEIEEEVEPFVRISDGIIRHFSHEHHHLRLVENMTCGDDYDENMQCQACITPIYFGNFYSCVHCEFVLHETCANLSRKLYHPAHRHMFTIALMGGIDDAVDPKNICPQNICFVCSEPVTAGFFYKCKGCAFMLHVKCATISEPLVHESHVHPLFLTSKPEERRICFLCQKANNNYTKETFNCIECDGFSLCFKCAAIPQKVRYKHDKHILALSYGEETSAMIYWCEACESKIYPDKGFYRCDEYCCVMLHIECLIGKDLYMKPGSSFSYAGRRVDVLSNNHHMYRPICSDCKKRCPHRIVLEYSGSIFCSLICRDNFFYKKNAY